jgi:hypothetical protein
MPPSRTELNTAREFREDRAHELRAVAEELRRARVVRDPEPLRRAAGECARLPTKVPLGWQYSLSRLAFRVAVPRNTFPAIPSGFLDLELSVKVAGICNTANHDPFTELAVDMHVYGEIGRPGSNVCTWHLDRHITGDAQPAAAHPLYHFQYGGRGMQSVQDSLGATLLVEAPRLKHPPMEAVLAIDFLLSQYDGLARERMMNISQYGLDLMATILAPDDQADLGGGSVAERHRRAGLGFHRPR